jgi:signal transduction histidine kinase/CheY-like chemotaxis protein
MSGHAGHRQPGQTGLRSWTGSFWPLIALLPVVLYSGALFWLIRSWQTQDLTEQARNSAVAIARSLEGELGEGFATLETLAGSKALEDGDLVGFRAEAAKVLQRHPEWVSVILTDTDRDLINLAVPEGVTVPPMQDVESFLRVRNTRQRTIGVMRNESVTLRIPGRGAVPSHTIAAVFPMSSFSRLVAPDRLPAGWMAAITDANFTFVARSPVAPFRLGANAGGEYAHQATNGGFQLRRITPQGAEPMLAGVGPVGNTGWTIMVGAPAELAEQPMQALRRLLLLGGVWAFAVAVGLCIWAVRRSRRVVEAEATKLVADLDRAAELDRRKTEFLTTVSHELRTPLTGIVGFTDLLAASRLSPEQREWVAHQRTAGRTLMMLIGDVLDFARIEEGGIELENVEFDLADLLRDSAEMMRPVAEHKRLALRVELARDLPRSVIGDPLRLRQILTNLVSNAVKFTRTGEVAIEAAVARGGHAGGEGRVLTIRVIDTGIGIAPEHIDKVFGRFKQAKLGTAREYGGSGLGLAISQRLTEAMGGSVRVESQVGVGTRFIVQVPLAVPRTEAARPAAAAAQPAPRHEDATVVDLRPKPGGGQILVADDVMPNQVLLRAVLEQAGYRVETVGDGSQAIQALRRARFDLCILDIQMPIVDGLEAARTVRASRGPEAGVPLIALTADVTVKMQSECLAAGFDAFAAKPFDGGRLLETIASLIAAKRSVPATAAA